VWLRENWLRVVFALVGVLLLTVGYFRLEQEVRTNAAQNRREEQANVLLHEQDRAIRAEGRKRCLVIKALIDYAAPADPVTLPIPPDADPALAQAIQTSNERSIANNAALRKIDAQYLPVDCNQAGSA
jgi:hypothetical protein